MYYCCKLESSLSYFVKKMANEQQIKCVQSLLDSIKVFYIKFIELTHN